MDTQDAQQFGEDVRTGKGSLGRPQQKSSADAQAESMLPDSFFDQRQARIRETRKYAGPVSEARSRSTQAEENTPDPVPPTHCNEPPLSAENT